MPIKSLLNGEVPVTPERSLLAAFAEAYVATQPKADALAFLRKVAQVLADREERDRVVIAMRRGDRARRLAEAKANHDAMTIFRQMLESCVARLNEAPEDDT